MVVLAGTKNTLFVQVEIIGCQGSEFEDPVALSLLPPCRATVMDLFDPAHLQIFHRVVWLAEMGCNGLLNLPRANVRAVAVHPDVQSVLLFSDIVNSTFVACYQINNVF